LHEGWLRRGSDAPKWRRYGEVENAQAGSSQTRTTFFTEMIEEDKKIARGEKWPHQI
jgi:hypothetical protein